MTTLYSAEYPLAWITTWQHRVIFSTSDWQRLWWIMAIEFFCNIVKWQSTIILYHQFINSAHSSPNTSSKCVWLKLLAMFQFFNCPIKYPIIMFLLNTIYIYIYIYNVEFEVSSFCRIRWYITMPVLQIYILPCLYKLGTYTTQRWKDGVTLFYT